MSVKTLAEESDVYPIGTPEYVYRFVLRLLHDLKATRVLDCPAGQGAFTARLLDAGFDATAGDIRPEQFKLTRRLECRYTDLNASLPFANDAFSAAVCLNGMHRIWARGRAISEFARVLTPGGSLILTNVNNVNLTHRLMALACGSLNYNTNGPPYGFIPDAEIPAAWYRAPLTIAGVVRIARNVGFDVERIVAIRWSRACIAVAPLAGVAWGLSVLLPRRVRQHVSWRESNGIPSLFGDYLAIVLRKASPMVNRQQAALCDAPCLGTS